MRLLRLGNSGDEHPFVLDSEGLLWDASPITDDYDASFFARDGLSELNAALNESRLSTVARNGSRVGTPIARPGKIVCVGLNYHRHARESGEEPPTEPVLFLKAGDTVIGPDDRVLIPLGSEKTDYEIELALVISREARYLSDPGEWRRYIAGYAISNDISERAFQFERGGQWDKGKNCETFNPLGPWLVTPDEVPDPQALALMLTVNGEVRQDSSTAEMIFPVSHLVWYVSQFMTLYPGDVINTGTPHGVGFGRNPPSYLRDGDEVSVKITGLGQQHHRFEATPVLA
jgi:2-keto-4-pentenoate hydratase/2-oxohepta-3-ene-1,7-dioic acid hydratase in catechol pathway